MRNKFLAFSLLVASFSSYAASYTGTIKNLVCHDADISPICQIQVNGVAPNLECATQAWRYTLNGTTTEGKNMLSILLAAQVARQEVVIGGKGDCFLSSTSEDIRHVYINTPE